MILFIYLLQDSSALFNAMKEDFGQPCNSISSTANLTETASQRVELRAGSTLSIIQYIYDKANQTLCTEDCQCSGSKVTHTVKSL